MAGVDVLYGCWQPVKTTGDEQKGRSKKGKGKKKKEKGKRKSKEGGN